MIQPAKVQKNTHIRKKTNTFFEKIGFYLILFCFSVSSAYPQLIGKEGLLHNHTIT